MHQFDFIFALRPSTVCNMRCSYCYRVDHLNQHHKFIKYDIDSMIWHSEQRPNNLFNFCGLGETMLHPQFNDMIIELSNVTNVNWVTNGTCFESDAFEEILRFANHKNIMDVIVSVHFGQIKDFNEYVNSNIKTFIHLSQLNIKVHFTTILTDENIDLVIEHRHMFPNLVIKRPFIVYVQNGIPIYHEYRKETLDKLEQIGLNPGRDYGGISIPYYGKSCPNGARIAEIMHDGKIFDCSFDENRILIGDINIKEPIRTLPLPRLCKAHCIDCIPVVRDGYDLLK